MATPDTCPDAKNGNTGGSRGVEVRRGGVLEALSLALLGQGPRGLDGVLENRENRESEDATRKKSGVNRVEARGADLAGRTRTEKKYCCAATKAHNCLAQTPVYSPQFPLSHFANAEEL